MPTSALLGITLMMGLAVVYGLMHRGQESGGSCSGDGQCGSCHEDSCETEEPA